MIMGINVRKYQESGFVEESEVQRLWNNSCFQN